MADYTQIKLDIADGIATITLHRPEKMNAYTGTMMTEMIDAFDRTDADDSDRAVIVTGAGDRAFCAGADLTPSDGKHVFSSGDAVEDLSDPRVRDGGGMITLRIYESKKPVIGAINGAAVGVGVTMQLPMDIRLATTIPQALEWCMTGRVFDAEEALRGGLVRSLHEPEDLMPAAIALAREIADNTSAVSVAMTRAMLWHNPSLSHPMEAHRVDSRAIYT
ncbi:MAG: enoyl-CoA hydratase-related protein, partial [Novosphingobium sp.]